jgi:hypothetical protein
MALITCSGQLTCHLVSGETSFEEIVKAIVGFYEEGPTENVLWDLRDASLDNLTADDVKAIVERAAALAKNHPEIKAGGKTAIVAPHDLELGIARIIQIQAENRFPFDVRAFRTTEAAIQWLTAEK